MDINKIDVIYNTLISDITDCIMEYNYKLKKNKK